MSPLAKERLSYQPELPPILKQLADLVAVPKQTLEPRLSEEFPRTSGQPIVGFQQGTVKVAPLRVGVVLSGGQAAGGHNVICGLFDALERFHPESELLGFQSGPSGIIEKRYTELTASLVAEYRNQGGFDMIGSGRTKIETEEQLESALATVEELKLDGLVVVGGDDSNTNAAVMAEYFRAHGSKCSVVGVPKTIDGDLRSDWIEMSFGCDTACKTYSATIGDIMRDALSAKKYWYFIKLMGRSASHITLECALQTHPNVTLISEEIAKHGWTLLDVTKQIADVVLARAAEGKNYGVVLIPEGIVEFMPEFKTLISELNRLLAADKGANELTAESKAAYDALPQRIREQLLMDRDPHGNVQVSKIETERLLIEMVTAELARREDAPGKFSTQPHFCGYEGRSCLPSNFDAQYCTALGMVAALLVRNARTGYIACVRGLSRPVSQWTAYGVPLTSMIHMEERHGKQKAVIEKALVDLKGAAFQTLQRERNRWAQEDAYRYPGPIQFAGPAELTEPPILTLQLESESLACAEKG